MQGEEQLNEPPGEQHGGAEAPPAPLPGDAAVRKRVFGLAAPVIGENLLETLLGIVDTLLVAGLGTVAIAGVGTGQQTMYFVLAALSALSVGSSVLVAQAVGARDLARAGRLARQSLVWSAVLSIPLALAGVVLAVPIIGVFGLQPDVADIAVGYFRVTMGTVVVLVALIIGGGVLRGAGDGRTPMKVTALANVVNVVLSWALIYGHLGMPALGAVGSAWATFIARGVALALLLRALWHGRNGVRLRPEGDARPHSPWRPQWEVAGRVLRLGVPAALEQILMSVAFVTLTILVARLGTETLAAQRISMTALSFSFMPGFGFAMAATALVGQSVGARRPHDGAGVARVATRWAVFWMGTIGVLVFAFAEPLMQLFTRSPEVVRIGAEGLRVVAVTQPAWAVGMVQSGALRGTGDTRAPMVITTTGMWCAVGLAWLVVSVWGGGLPVVWGAFLVTSPIAAAVVTYRFRRRIRMLAKQEDGPAGEPPSREG